MASPLKSYSAASRVSTKPISADDKDKKQSATSGKHDYDKLLRIVLVGTSDAYKSTASLLHVEESPDEFISTIGVDFKLKHNISIPGANNARAQIWDTAGQERFKTITRGYFVNCSGIIGFYSVTNYDSFLFWQNTINQIKEYSPKGTPILCVGETSETDKLARVVTTDEGMAFAAQHNLPFFEISAKSKSDVDRVFNHLYKIIGDRECAREFELEQSSGSAAKLAQAACEVLHTFQTPQIPQDVNNLITSYISPVKPKYPQPAKSSCVVM